MAKHKHLVLFLIDGMRPDGMLQAETPTIDHLMATGAHTLTAQTVVPSATLPCHTSLFYGVKPERHGITTNTWSPPVRPVPSLIEALYKNGLNTAMFYNWGELRDMTPPGNINTSFFINTCYEPAGVGDTKLASLTANWLRDNQPNFAFVYFSYTDIAGHMFGWMSEEYIQGISNADRCVTTVLDVLAEDTVIIVTSDHGGHAQTHGNDCPEDVTIPFIISGQGIVLPGQVIDQPLNITDIAPLIADFFEVKAPSEWIGQPIKFGRVGL